MRLAAKVAAVLVVVAVVVGVPVGAAAVLENPYIAGPIGVTAVGGEAVFEAYSGGDRQAVVEVECVQGAEVVQETRRQQRDAAVYVVVRLRWDQGPADCSAEFRAGDGSLIGAVAFTASG